MLFHYPWICSYLKEPPTLEEAARLLNETGLETEPEDQQGLEIEHTVNRPDAMCHYGVARELAVKGGFELQEPSCYRETLPGLPDFEIRSLEPEHCPQYMAVRIDGVTASPSPSWLQERLASIGQTSHNLLVDLTNFLLWEFGHPCHAFDREKISGKQILIRFGKTGEHLTTLEGKQHETQGLLCIADSERPIAFGGVMGGENSEVTDSTTSLLLELACFRGATVRATGKRARIESDARHRFERGVDRENMERVIRRFIYLLLQEQPDALVIGLLNHDPAPFQRVPLTLRRERLQKVLGISLPDPRVEQLLKAMDFRPQTFPGGWRVTVPGYKVDVNREVDVIEEIIRFAGLDLLPSRLPSFSGTDYAYDPLHDSQLLIRETLVGFGLQETCTYSFLAEREEALFGSEGEPVRLRNPMTKNQAVMRRNLLPSLLEVVVQNQKRGNSHLSFFEMGHVFSDGSEPHHLAVVFTQDKENDNWWEGGRQHLFYHIKGIFEALSSRLAWHHLEIRPPAPAFFDRETAVGIWWQARCIGGFGMPSAALIENLELNPDTALLEIDLSFLKETGGPSFEHVTLLSPFPSVRQDMAFVLDRSHEYRDLRGFIESLNPPFLESLSLFDLYEGKAVGTGKKSMGFRFVFRSPSRTLTGEEVAQTMDLVVQSVIEKFGAVIRI